MFGPSRIRNDWMRPAGARLPAQIAHAAQVALALFADVGDEDQIAEVIGESGNARIARAMASSAASPAPLSATPGPCNRPSGATKTLFVFAWREHRVEVRGESDVRAGAIFRADARSTLPPRSMRAMHPSARNCASIHSARRCSKNVEAGMRQSCRCCSLIHCFCRTNHCSASRRGGVSANSAAIFESGGSAGRATDLMEAAKC